MKPILFNTGMVRAILDNRKTVTRRVVRPRYCDSVFEMFRGELCEASPYKPPRNNGDGTTTCFVRTYAPCKAPYRPGDILYVRETWRVQSARRFDADARIMFKAGGDMVRVQFPGGGDQYHSRTKYDLFVHKWADDRWHPSIHMPREAARIFLRVTNVYPQQLKDVTEADARAEGFNSRDEFMSEILKMYPDCTEDSWFWANKFERISREEAGLLSKLTGCEHLSELACWPVAAENVSACIGSGAG